MRDDYGDQHAAGPSRIQTGRPESHHNISQDHGGKEGNEHEMHIDEDDGGMYTGEDDGEMYTGKDDGATGGDETNDDMDDFDAPPEGGQPGEPMDEGECNSRSTVMGHSHRSQP